jgi:hypothetical protein
MACPDCLTLTLVTGAPRKVDCGHCGAKLFAMESAARAIRDAWFDAIKDVENAKRARLLILTTKNP